MKFLYPSLLLAFATSSAADPCLSSYSIAADSCSYDAFVSSLQAELTSVGCAHGAAIEMQLTLGQTQDEAQSAIAEACSESHLPFGEITGQGHIFDKEYYDGGTYYNEERQSFDKNGITIHKLETDPGDRIEQIYDVIAQSRGITFPENLINFDSCELNAAMCCFVQDRQARDNNGNCATPYDENCVDADPADNTDICYVDMSRSPTSSRTTDGFSLFEHEDEDDSHCHGFAWAEDPTDPSARFKGNNLFYVSMYDHLTQRGYARNVPGGPMCACVEQMPVVTRADCTEIAITEDVTFTYSSADGLSAAISNLDINFNACQGANGNNNDLGAYYERLLDEEKISDEKRDSFYDTVVGETYCREAIDEFLDSKGLTAPPQCKNGSPSECGCANILQADYRGDIAVTKNGRECQRWDSQTPHTHSRTRSRYPDAGLVENYCRNPDGEHGGAWCYTTDPDVRWEYCDVDVCELSSAASPSDAEIIQAESAKWSNARVKSGWVGYTGRGYIDMGGQGSWIEWSVDGGAGGLCELDFRYTLGDLNNRECELTVNGNSVSTVNFAPTSSWSDYQNDIVSIPCEPGVNKIRLTVATVEGGPNVDKLTIALPKVTNIYQPDDATLSNSFVKSNHIGYTGTGYVDMGGNGSWIEWSIDGGAGGPCELDFRYASDDTTYRECEVTLNGNVVASPKFSPTSSWKDFRNDVQSIICPPGVNTLRLTASTSEGGPNVDKLTVIM